MNYLIFNAGDQNPEIGITLKVHLQLAAVNQLTGSEGQSKLLARYEYIESTVGHMRRSCSNLSRSVDTSRIRRIMAL